MAGPNAPIPYDFNAAHEAGLTDAQIVQSISKSGKVPNYDFEGALAAGASPGQIVQMLGGAPEQSGLWDSLRQGVAAPVAGIGKTLETHVGENPVSSALEKGAHAVTAATYTPAPLYDKQGLHPGNIPAWLAANAPSMGVALSAAKATPGPWWAKALGGAAAGFLMNAGNEDQKAANIATGKPDAKPSWANVARGDLAAAAENAVGSLPFARYLPGANKLGKVGVKGVAQALGRYGTTVGAQAAASAGGDAAGQAIQTAGTPGGAVIDPTEVANSAAGGALGGAYFDARPALRTALNARAFSGLGNTPEMRQAAAQVANTIQDHADGENLNGGYIVSRKAQRSGQEAVAKTAIGVNNNLNSAITDVRTTQVIPTDANNVIKGVLKNKMPNAADYETLQQAVQGNPYGPALLSAVRQAHALHVFQGLGHTVGGRFTGGIEGIASHILSGENLAKSSVVGLAAAAGESAGHIIAYSPHVIGAAMGATALARLADSLTGAHTPAGRIVNNFADPNVSTSLPSVLANAPGASVPAIPLVRPTPWGTTQPPATAPAAPINPLVLPRSITAPARTLSKYMVPGGPAVRVPTQAQALKNLSQGAPVPPVAAPRAGFVPPTTAAPIANDALAAMIARQKAANPTAVTKANGKIGTENGADDYVIPRSPYAELSPMLAAQSFLADALKGGTQIGSKQGFINGTVRNIEQIRQRAALVAKEVPTINPSELSAQFEGAATQKQAIAHREWLKAHDPQAAAALDMYFSDQAIKGTALHAGIWKRKG